MTWRGAVWGLALGIFSFAVFYGFLTIINSIPELSASMTSFFDNYQPHTAGQRILVHLLLGLAAGGTIGVPLKFLLGILGGMMLGILTRAFFFPRTNPSRFKRIVSVWGGVGGFIWEFFGLLLYSLLPIFRNYEFYQGNPILQQILLEEVRNILSTAIPYLLVPATFTGIMSAYVANRLLRWYERESAKGIAQNVAPN
jgi:hypothetical protein